MAKWTDPRDTAFLRRIGLKIHRELFGRRTTIESLSRAVGIARSTIREVVAGRSNVRILTLRSIVRGLGFASIWRFFADIEED